MRALQRILRAVGIKPAAPKLWQGPYMDVTLQPSNGTPERSRILGAHGIKNYWCTFTTEKVQRGKYAGSDRVVVLVDGVRVGHLDPSKVVRNQNLLDALNSGISAATVVLERDRSAPDDVTARLMLGNHRYMPRPYWE